MWTKTNRGEKLMKQNKKQVDIHNWLDVAIEEYEKINRSIYCKLWEEKLLNKLYELREKEKTQ
tara:strand:+ start:260 stop:448 length:189 start_codon:yes stop_codon:yes gene_type:complete